MAAQTSLVAQQVSIRQWAEQIHDCQSHPKVLLAEIFSGVSPEILCRLIEAFNHAE